MPRPSKTQPRDPNTSTSATSPTKPDPHARTGDAADVGRFRYRPTAGRWEWDETTSRLHGLPARPRVMTSEALLDLVHAEDQERVAVILGDRPANRLRLTYRVQPTPAEERELLVVAHAASLRGVFSLEGHVVDLTAELQAVGERAGGEAVAAAMEGRSAIEQAKGGLMLAYGLGADQAFALLRWWSRNHNVRVRLLAERLMAAAQEGRHSDQKLRAAFDDVLHDLTVDR